MIGRDLPSRILERALEASSVRQQVLSNNIANVKTPGFKRSRVDFEGELAQALAAKQNPDAIRPAVVREADSLGRPDGNNVDIEAEMVKVAENQIWQAALARQISDHFSRLNMAIHDGRR